MATNHLKDYNFFLKLHLHKAHFFLSYPLTPTLVWDKSLQEGQESFSYRMYLCIHNLYMDIQIYISKAFETGLYRIV